MALAGVGVIAAVVHARRRARSRTEEMTGDGVSTIAPPVSSLVWDSSEDNVNFTLRYDAIGHGDDDVAGFLEAVGGTSTDPVCTLAPTDEHPSTARGVGPNPVYHGGISI